MFLPATFWCMVELQFSLLRLCEVDLLTPYRHLCTLLSATCNSSPTIFVSKITSVMLFVEKQYLSSFQSRILALLRSKGVPHHTVWKSVSVWKDSTIKGTRSRIPSTVLQLDLKPNWLEEVCSFLSRMLKGSFCGHLKYLDFCTGNTILQEIKSLPHFL